MTTQTIGERPASALAGVSHNCLGQRLGRKGLETRERILTAALRLLEAPEGGPITLTLVAREASVGLTTLYLYFPDLGDLVLAALARMMDEADSAFLDRLRSRWPDARLEACCLEFLRAHYGFWRQHARLLHMRNSLADANDARFLAYRNDVSMPLIALLVQQMDGEPGQNEPCIDLATVLLTGFERLATVLTNPNWHAASGRDIANEAALVDRLMRAEAELIAGAIARKRGESPRAKELARRPKPIGSGSV